MNRSSSQGFNTSGLDSGNNNNNTPQRKPLSNEAVTMIEDFVLDLEAIRKKVQLGEVVLNKRRLPQMKSSSLGLLLKPQKMRQTLSNFSTAVGSRTQTKNNREQYDYDTLTPPVSQNSPLLNPILASQTTLKSMQSSSSAFKYNIANVSHFSNELDRQLNKSNTLSAQNIRQTMDYTLLRESQSGKNNLNKTLRSLRIRTQTQRSSSIASEQQNQDINDSIINMNNTSTGNEDISNIRNYQNQSPMMGQFQSTNASFFKPAGKKLRTISQAIKLEDQQSIMSKIENITEINVESILNKTNNINNDIITIKIENIRNYKSQPVAVYDEQSLEKDKILDSLKEGFVMSGFSRWKDLNGEVSWKKCNILGFNQDTKLYRIQWIEGEQIKEVTRLNLMVESESVGEFKEREDKAYSRREQKLFSESLAKLVGQKSQNSDVVMQKSLLINILQKTFVNSSWLRSEYGEATVEAIIEEYKFHVLRFQIALKTTPSLQQFYEKYLPSLVMKKKATKVLPMQYTIEISVTTPLNSSQVGSGENLNNYNNIISVSNSPKRLFKQSSQNSEQSDIYLTEAIDFVNEADICVDILNQSSILSSPTENMIIPNLNRESNTRSNSHSPSSSIYTLLRHNSSSNTSKNSQIDLPVPVGSIRKLIIKHDASRRFQELHGYLLKNLFGTQAIFSLGNINGVFPVVIALLHIIESLQDHRIFHYFHTAIASGFTDYNQLFTSLQTGFSKEIEKIETVIYKMEKTIDLLKVDLEQAARLREQQLIVHRELPPFDVYIRKYLAGMQSNCNLLLKSHLNITVRESLHEIELMFERYYLTIPLPNVSKDLLDKLPVNVKAKKHQACIQGNLQSPFPESSLPSQCLESSLSSPSHKTSFQFDSEMIFDIYCEIITRSLSLNAQDTYLFRPIHNIDPLPISNFTLTLSKYRKNPPIKFIYQYFMRCRDKIYGCSAAAMLEITKVIVGEKTKPWRPKSKTEDPYENQLQYVIYDILRLNTKDTYFISDFLEKCKNKAVSYQRLGWFDTKHMRISIEPSLETMEERLNMVFSSSKQKLCEIEEINGFMHNKLIENSEDVIKEFDMFNSSTTAFLQWNYYSIYAILAVYNNFDFYLIEKDYLEELLEIFNHSNQVQFLIEERNKLLQDKLFISRGLPGVFRVGMFDVDTMEIKSMLIKKITGNINRIDRAIVEKFSGLLSQTSQSFKEIQGVLSEDPNTIDKYIDLMTFLNTKELKKKWQQCQIDLKTINLLFDMINENYIEFDQFGDCSRINNSNSNVKKEQDRMSNSNSNQNSLLLVYLESKNWLRNLMELFIAAKVKLDARQAYFQSILQDLKTSLLGKFSGVKEAIKEFKLLNNLRNCEGILKRAREIEDLLKQVVQEGLAVNNRESILNYELSDLSAFNECLKNFDCNLLFWDFCEKWYRQAEQWLCYPFEKLMSGQNGNAQETLRLEILDACREGSALMETLDKEMVQEMNKLKEIEQEGNDNQDKDKDTLQHIEYIQKFRDNIESIQKDIDDFNQYLPIIMMLLNKSFKETYWTQLLTEIYGIDSKVRPQELTINVLKMDNILRYKQLIYILFNKSQQELRLFEEIDRIENLIMECLPKIQTSKNPDYPQHFIGNVQFLTGKLEELQFNVMSVVSQFDNHEKLKLMCKYVEELKMMFGNMIMIQDEIMLLCPFFGVINDFIPDSKQIRTRLRNQNLKIKEDFKKKALLTKNFVQKIIDTRELSKLSSLRRETESLLNQTMILKKETQSYIKGVRLSNARFLQLPDESIIRMMSSNFSNEELKQFIIEVFPGVHDIQFESKDENFFQIDFVTNYYHEAIYPHEVLKVPRMPRLSGGGLCCSSNGGNLPVSVLVRELEKCLTGRIKRNIFQNLSAVASSNYDYQNFWKLYQNKQVLFQTLYLMLDLCFYSDLTFIVQQPECTVDATTPRQTPDYERKSNNRQIYLKEFVHSNNPKKRLGLMEKHLNEEMLKFLDFIKLKSKAFASKMNTYLYNQLILQSLSQRDILRGFIRDGVSDLNSFEYLCLPKFTLAVNSQNTNMTSSSASNNNQQGQGLLAKAAAQVNQTNNQFLKLSDNPNEFPSLTAESEYFIALKEHSSATIQLITMNHSCEYGYELSQEIKYFIISQSSSRMICNLISAVSSSRGSLIVSQDQFTRDESVKHLAILLAKPFLFRSSVQLCSQDTILRLLVGAAQGGFWLEMQGLQDCSYEVLSQISSIAADIQRALIESKETIDFQEYLGIKLNPNVSLFTSFSHRTRQFDELPHRLLQSMRIIALSPPDVPFVIQCYFTLMGVKDVPSMSHQFLFFMRLIGERFFMNLCNYANQLTEESTGKHRNDVILNQSSCLQILQGALELQRQKLEVDDFIHPLEAFKTALLMFFRNTLSSVEYVVLIHVYDSVFGYYSNTNPQSQPMNLPPGMSIHNNSQSFSLASSSPSAALSANETEQTDLLKEYFELRKEELHETLVSKAISVLSVLDHQKSLLLVGRAGFGKSKLLKVCAFVAARQHNREFLVVTIPIESLNADFLLGKTSKTSKNHSSNHKNSGILPSNTSIVAAGSGNGGNSSQSSHSNHSHLSKGHTVTDDSNDTASTSNDHLSDDSIISDGLLVKILDSFSLSSHPLIQQRTDIILSSQSVAAYYPVKAILDTNNNNKIITLPAKNRYLSHQDWIVFDAGEHSSKHSRDLSCLLLDAVHHQILPLPSGQSKKLSNTQNAYIFEMESLSHITPRSLSSVSIVVLEKELISVREEFFSWLNKKCFQQPRIEKYTPYLKCIFNNFIVHCLQWIHTQRNQANLFLFAASKKQCYLGFINIFEILLNELRKREIALGLFDYSELSIRERKNTPDPILLRKTSNVQQELKQFQMLSNATAKGNITCERTCNQIEAISMASVLNGMCNCLNDAGKIKFCEFVVQLIKEYCSKDFKFQFEKESFAFDLLSRIDNAERDHKEQLQQQRRYQNKSSQHLPFALNLFDLCFSLSDSIWIEWNNVILMDYLDEISNDYTQNVLNTRELVRLNPNAVEIEEIANYIDNKQDFRMAAFSTHMYHETAATKIQNYFLELSLAYNKKILFCSNPKQGKTTLIRKIMNRLFKKNQNSVLHLSVSSPGINLARFQEMMQCKLKPKFFQSAQQSYQQMQLNMAQSFQQPGTSNTFVFIDDLHLVERKDENSREDSNDNRNYSGDVLLLLKQLLDLKGWYSLKDQKFKKFKPFSMMAALSVHSAESSQSSDTFEYSLECLPQKLLQKSFVMFLSDFNQDSISAIFRKHIGAIYRNQVDFSSIDKLIVDIWEEFSVRLFQKQKMFTTLKRRYNSTLSLQEGFRMASYFNQLEFMHAEDTLNEELFLKGFVFLFNAMFCDNFSSNSLEEQQGEKNQAAKRSKGKRRGQKVRKSQGGQEVEELAKQAELLLIESQQEQGQNSSKFDFDDGLTVSSIDEGSVILDEQKKRRSPSSVSVSASESVSLNNLSLSSQAINAPIVETNNNNTQEKQLFRFKQSTQSQRKQIISSLVQFDMSHFASIKTVRNSLNKQLQE